jgi:hypothetical protein
VPRQAGLVYVDVHGGHPVAGLTGASASSRKLTIPHCSTPGSCTLAQGRCVSSRRSSAPGKPEPCHCIQRRRRVRYHVFLEKGRAAVAFAASKRIGSHRGTRRTAERVYRPFLARCCRSRAIGPVL